MKTTIRCFVFTLTLLTVAVTAQTTSFSYQGKLTDLGTAPSATYEMEFRLFDALANGNQIGSSVSNANVSVVGGVFSVQLDFGQAVFTGADRYLDISIRRHSGESFTNMVPRQKLGSAPYAIKSKSTELASNAAQLGGVAANEYVTNSALSTNVIRNQTGQQPNSNFNISGNGIFGGQVGINAPLEPGYSLNVLGGTRTFSSGAAHFVAQTIGGKNSWARLYLRSQAQSWFMGTSQEFNGNQFYLVDETSNHLIRMTIQPGGGAVSFTTGFVGIGTSNPTARLHVVANSTGHGTVFHNLSGRAAEFTGGITVNGTSNLGQTFFSGNIAVNGTASGNLASFNVGEFGNVQTSLVSGGTFSLCWYSPTRTIATCSSSLRYKKDASDFSSGLDVVRRMRPITFTWKSDGKRDLGFAAEEVAAIDPLLATYNQNGEIEGVKYAQLSVLFVNAFKEQQAQIERQQAQIDRLTELVCSLLGGSHEMCRER